MKTRIRQLVASDQGCQALSHGSANGHGTFLARPLLYAEGKQWTGYERAVSSAVHPRKARPTVGNADLYEDA